MNYFLISNMYPDEKSPGYGCFVKNICEGLSENGIIKSYSAVIKGCATSKLKKVYKYLKVYFQIIFYYFRSFDFIYIHYPNQFIPLLFLLRKLKKRNIVVNFHGEDLLYQSYGYRKILGRLTESFCRRYADAIVVPSEYFRNIISEKKIIDDSKIIISPSGGINPQIFYPSQHRNWIKNHVHIGFVGRLQIAKGIMVFAETFKLLKEHTHISVMATVIGYGECYDQLIEYIKQNNLSEHFNVITGVPQVELGKYYREMNLFIFNSSRKSESLGLTGLEAMGCGVPVIGSSIGGIASYVKDGYNGWLTPVADVQAILDKIKTWVNLSETEKHVLKDHAIDTAKKYYLDDISSSLAKSIEKKLKKR